MPFLIYLVQVCLYSGALWVIYCLIWRGKSIHRGSRAYLLLAALLPLLLPFIRLQTESTANAWMPRYQLPDFQVAANSIATAHSVTPAWSIYYAYAFIALMLMCFYAAGYIRILRTVATGKRQLVDGNTVYINTGIGPGTIGRRIFFPGQTHDEQILRHEAAHIRAGHRYDLLLMQVLASAFWANPFMWIMLRELKMVHEFEADAQVTDGKNISAYTDLLLSEVFGLRRANIVHSFFHHPLKRRIIMLQKSWHHRSAIRAITAGTLLTAVFITSILFAQTKHRVVEKSSSKAADSIALMRKIEAHFKANPPKEQTGSNVVQPDGRTVYKFVDQMPAFEGDLTAYLSTHLHYPDSARAHNQQGRAVVQFIVDEQGRPTSPQIVRSSGSALLDNEAIRVVREMPSWKPGMQKGVPVAVLYTLPVSFKLD